MKFVKVGDYIINSHFITRVELDSQESPSQVNLHIREEFYRALQGKGLIIEDDVDTIQQNLCSYHDRRD